MSLHIFPTDNKNTTYFLWWLSQRMFAS